jgi:hypothetical protein
MEMEKFKLKINPVELGMRGGLSLLYLPQPLSPGGVRKKGERVSVKNFANVDWDFHDSMSLTRFADTIFSPFLEERPGEMVEEASV